MSVKVGDQSVVSITEMAVAAFFAALVLAPLLEMVAVYEAGRRAAEPRPLWEPF